MINNCERKFKLSKRKLFSCSFFRSTVSHEDRSNGMTTWSHENHGDKFSRRIQNSLTVTAIRFMRLCELYNEISSFNRSPTRVMQAWKFGKSIIESERKYRFFSPPVYLVLLAFCKNWPDNEWEREEGGGSAKVARTDELNGRSE